MIYINQNGIGPTFDFTGGRGTSVSDRSSSGYSQNIQVTDIISEGPIAGLVDGNSSIFLNDDRAQDIKVAPQNLSNSPARINITPGETSVTITGATLSYPTEYSGNVLDGYTKYFMVKAGWGTTTVQGAPEKNGNLWRRLILSVT